MKKKNMFVFLGPLTILALAGCASTRTTSFASLENRVGVLETRVGDVETRLAAAPSSVSASVPVSEVSVKKESTATVETMTKKDIQQALKNAGYYDGQIDGKIGHKTKIAIDEFQKNMGLKVDGVAGKNTKEKLLKYLQ